MSQPIVARYLVFLYFFIELDVPTNSAAQTPFLCLHRNVRDQFQPILSFSALHNFYKHPSVIYQKLENNVFFYKCSRDHIFHSQISTNAARSQSHRQICATNPKHTNLEQIPKTPKFTNVARSPNTNAKCKIQIFPDACQIHKYKYKM